LPPLAQGGSGSWSAAPHSEADTSYVSREGVAGELHLDLHHRSGLAPAALLTEYDRLVEQTLRPGFKRLSEQEKADTYDAIQEVKAEIVAATNRFNHVLSTTAGLHSVYVSLMSTMLMLFVPQTCHDAGGTRPHACSLSEIVGELPHRSYSAFVFALNLASLALALVSEGVMFARESWLDKAMVVDASLAPNNLSSPQPDDERGRSLLQQQPYVAQRLLRLNLTVGTMARLSSVCLVVNFVCSAVLILDPNRTEGCARPR
jgi:hypothetical protein